LNPARARRELGAWVDDIDPGRNGFQPPWPKWRGTAQQQGPLERPGKVPKPVETFLKGPFKEEQVGTEPSGTIAAQRAQLAVEEVAGHGRACAAARQRRQEV
jgi:hypothetical protein